MVMRRWTYRSWLITSRLTISCIVMTMCYLARFLSNKVVAQVSFSLHRLLEESCIQLAASLLDQTQKPIKVL